MQEEQWEGAVLGAGGSGAPCPRFCPSCPLLQCPGVALTSVHIDRLLIPLSAGTLPIAIFIIITRRQGVCEGKRVGRDIPACRAGRAVPALLPRGGLGAAGAPTHDRDGEVAQDLPSSPCPAHVEP